MNRKLLLDVNAYYVFGMKNDLYKLAHLNLRNFNELGTIIIPMLLKRKSTHLQRSSNKLRSTMSSCNILRDSILWKMAGLGYNIKSDILAVKISLFITVMYNHFVSIHTHPHIPRMVSVTLM